MRSDASRVGKSMGTCNQLTIVSGLRMHVELACSRCTCSVHADVYRHACSSAAMWTNSFSASASRLVCAAPSTSAAFFILSGSVLT